jgi:fermentation-respiration switch protein FrsA (DUF1100 family)
MTAKTDQLMRRWQSQRWLLDAVIRTVGVEWDQPRLAYMGAPAGPEGLAEMRMVGARIRRAADFDREFANAARRREARAKAYADAGRTVGARENYLLASLLWASARWPIFELNDTLVKYEEHMDACYRAYAELAAHPVEVVDVPFAGKAMPAHLHLPRKPAAGEKFPCVINIPGMDSSKENGVSMYGDPLLQRGMAVLSIDGPGQGESVTRGIYSSETNYMDAARAMFDWLANRPEIDAGKIAIRGTSFGTFWGTQAAAALGGRIRGAALVGVCQEPGCNTIFNMASPSYKLRYMFMSNYQDEDAFDRFASKLDLRPIAKDVAAPYMVVAGSDDQLSPIECTYELFAQIKAPKTLVVYEGANHSVSEGMSVSLGENRLSLIADWLADRMDGKPLKSERIDIDPTGRATVSAAA